MGKGAEWASILVIIGGLVWLSAGAIVFGFLIYDLYQVGFTGGNPDDKMSFLIRVGIALYFCVMSIWVTTFGFWMKGFGALRDNSKKALIFGVLTLNVLAIVGGILGLNSDEEGVEKFVIGSFRDESFKKNTVGVTVR